eukprot:192761_1
MTQQLKCDKSFSQCINSNRIKLVLQRYDKIIDNKSDNAEQQILQNDLINNILPSNVELLNDFYHIKYDHNINDNTSQFNSFYQYLFDHKDVLKCDISYCQSAKRYYNQRNRSYNSSENDRNFLNLICRIHTYLIHAYETDRLTTDEIHYIETKMKEFKHENEQDLNDKKLQIISEVINSKKRKISMIHASDNSKYITTHDLQSLNAKKISAILKDNGIFIEENVLTNACEAYAYCKQQLINDLCDIMLNGEHENILLVQIFSNELHFIEQNTRQRIYDIILHQYIKKQDLNNENFIKILRKTVSKLFVTIDCDKVEDIARNANLTGNIFIKTSSEFKNSVTFAQIFASIDNWKRKQWSKIYAKIRKWQITKNTMQLSNKSIVMQKVKTTYCKGTNSTDYIDKQTDSDLIDEFCTITKATKEIAITFLETTEWNILFAIHKYYAANGKLSKQNDESTHNKAESKQVIYNLGISFWYWEKQKLNKRYVRKKFLNLKQEI